jgi:hypothetical protein
MKTIEKIIILAALIVLFGAFPVKALGIALEWLAVAFKAIAEWIEISGWGGVL